MNAIIPKDPAAEEKIDYSRPVPCYKYARENSLPEQLAHILGELNEVWEAVTDYTVYTDVPEMDRKGRIAEELTDVITSCRTALTILGYPEVEVECIQVNVNLKNRNRGYWEVKK